MKANGGKLLRIVPDVVNVVRRRILTGLLPKMRKVVVFILRRRMTEKHIAAIFEVIGRLVVAVTTLIPYLNTVRWYWKR